MYLCLDCGRLFYDPSSYTETHGLDTPPYETWSGCPHCSGTYVETRRCEYCDEWITGEYVEFDDGMTVCESCYRIKNICDERW